MPDDQPKWLQFVPVGFVVVIALFLMVVIMVLTADRPFFGQMNTEEANRSIARSTAQLARYQLVTIVVALPTLLLLAWNFVVTRAMAKASQQSVNDAQQAQRAHLFVKDMKGLNIFNHGNTPALNVNITVYATIEFESAPEHDVHSAHLGLPAALVRSTKGQTLSYIEKDDYRVAEPIRFKDYRVTNRSFYGLFYWVDFRYDDIFGNKHRTVMRFTDRGEHRSYLSEVLHYD